jgi:hypothetical protein
VRFRCDDSSNDSSRPKIRRDVAGRPTILPEIRRDGLTCGYTVPTNSGTRIGPGGRRGPCAGSVPTLLSVSPSIGTIEHVFGPSLQQIATKWREMAAPKSDGEKTMFAHELSPVSDETRPAPPEPQRE